MKELADLRQFGIEMLFQIDNLLKTHDIQEGKKFNAALQRKITRSSQTQIEISSVVFFSLKKQTFHKYMKRCNLKLPIEWN